MRTTHTFAELEISVGAWEEIAELLRSAGYHHVFIGDVIDMNGIGLVAREREQQEDRKKKANDIDSLDPH